MRLNNKLICAAGIASALFAGQALLRILREMRTMGGEAEILFYLALWSVLYAAIVCGLKLREYGTRRLKILSLLLLAGSCLLLLYGWLRNDFAIILGQFLSYYIYLWNLKDNGLWRKVHPAFRLLLLLSPPAAAAGVVSGGADLAGMFFRNPDIPLPMLAFGCASQALFTLRFVYQWWYSARHGVSVLPMGFWLISFSGSVLICIYGMLRLDIVLILGQSLGLIAYARNIRIGLRSSRRA